MRRHVSLFWHYFLQYAKIRLEHRWDFFISVLTMTLATVFGLAVVYLIFGRTQAVAGWSFGELLFLYGFSLLPMSVFNVVSVNLYQFSDNYLIQGKFDRVLLRPVHSLFQILFEQLRLEALGDAVLGLAILSVAMPFLPRPLSGAAWLVLALGVVCGAMIYTAVFVVLTSVSFWVEDRVGIMPPVYNFIQFGRYPLDIYNGFIRVLLSWIIPFGFATFYPAAAALRFEQYVRYLWLLPVVTATSWFIALSTWNRGIRAYGSTGN
ncbi:MAG: ABC-2 family transporter protein [Bryobacteraceae bacterium]|nr:ABC-2 family transporter protein [Bryobacteraceae bacterium]MDW8376574.1 ABC-2 family transporter protein [Bryobacterales bacterium]